MTNVQLEKYELTHAHGGGPLFMVENVDREYCQVVLAARDIETCARSIVYLAYKPKLSIFQKPDKDNKYEMVDSVIAPKIRADLDKVRQQIREGKLRKQNNRLVDVTT